MEEIDKLMGELAIALADRAKLQVKYSDIQNELNKADEQTDKIRIDLNALVKNAVNERAQNIPSAVADR